MIAVHAKHALIAQEVPLGIMKAGKDVLVQTIVVFVTILYAQNVLASTQIVAQNVLLTQMIPLLTIAIVSVTAHTSNSSLNLSARVTKDVQSVLH
jgi:hypothetical protein